MPKVTLRGGGQGSKFIKATKTTKKSFSGAKVKSVKVASQPPSPGQKPPPK